MNASVSRVPFGVLLALAAALYACRARDGERCACAEDCGEDLACVAEGRILAEGECTPVVGEDANPGVCMPAEDALEDEGGGGPPEVFMDLGAKRDFDPGLPPELMTESGTETGTTDATSTGESTSTGEPTSTGATTSTGSSSTGGSSSGTSTGGT